jgi:CubicO group peptidase (beta-lactamase class C family)
MTSRTGNSATGGAPRVHGAYDPAFARAVSTFARLFPQRAPGGGALSVYLDGQPVVDVWSGWESRRDLTPWTANTGAMVFSATKGLASTVVHRLHDRGLIDYDAPVAEFWPAFATNGKGSLTVRDMMAHRGGLSQLNGVTSQQVLDHLAMEELLAAAPPGVFFGRSAYHALTYGWILSGLARAVTGSSMRELFRSELAQPLDTDGIHLGRPPAGAPTRAAQIATVARTRQNRRYDNIAARIARHPRSALFGAIYFAGVRGSLQNEMQFLDAEIPSANAVATARGIGRVYGAIANGGSIDGVPFLSPQTVSEIARKRAFPLDRSVYVPLGFHLGYHGVAATRLMPGFGHAGLGGSAGWADPASGLAIAFVHSRLHASMVIDQVAFAVLFVLARRAAARARRHGFSPVGSFGAPYTSSPNSSTT